MRMDALTQRETEILLRIKEGMTNREIAMELGIACNTVNSHVAVILLKLGAKNRTHAAVIARDGSGHEI